MVFPQRKWLVSRRISVTDSKGISGYFGIPGSPLGDLSFQNFKGDAGGASVAFDIDLLNIWDHVKGDAGGQSVAFGHMGTCQR